MPYHAPRKSHFTFILAGFASNPTYTVEFYPASHVASSWKTPPGPEGSKGIWALAGAWEVFYFKTI